MTDDLTPWGPMVDAVQVEDAVISWLQLWFDTYLCRMEEMHGETPGGWARPRSWIKTVDFDIFPEAQLPTVLVMCPNLASTPKKHGGEGSYTADFAVSTAVILSANTQSRADQLAKLYEAALRWIMLQKSNIGGVANAVTWLGTAYDDLTFMATRNTAAGKSLFTVEVQDILFANRGPAGDTPPSDPTAGYDQDVTVETIQIEASPTNVTEVVL